MNMKNNGIYKKYNLISHKMNYSSLNYSFGYWDIQNSYIKIPLLSIKNIFEDNEYISNQIKWRCKEILEIIGISGGLILDIRTLEQSKLPIINSVIEEYKVNLSPFIIVGTKSQRPFFNNEEKKFCWTQSFSSAFEASMKKLQELKRIKKKIYLSENWLRNNIKYISLPVSDIKFNCYEWYILENIKAGYIEFSGVYEYGSDGDMDGLFIRLRIDEFFDRLKPEALIINLQNLEYEWGDNLCVYPVQFMSEGSPIRIVIKERQLNAFTGMLREADIQASLEESFLDLINYMKFRL